MAGSTPRDSIKSAFEIYNDKLLKLGYSPSSPGETIQDLWGCIKRCRTALERLEGCSPEDKQYIFNTLQTMICHGAPIPKIARTNQQSEDPSLEITSRFLIYVASPNDTTPGSSEVSSKQDNPLRISRSCMMTLGEILEMCTRDNNIDNPHAKAGYNHHSPHRYTHVTPKTMGWVNDDFANLIQDFEKLKGQSTL
jgi:hypothetical protein